jgi:hypothetical protein
MYCESARHNIKKCILKMTGRAKDDAHTCNHIAVTYDYLQAEFGEFTMGPLSYHQLSGGPGSGSHFNVKTVRFEFPHQHVSPIIQDTLTTHQKSAAAQRRYDAIPDPLMPGPLAAHFHTNNTDELWKLCTCLPRRVVALAYPAFKTGDYLQAAWPLNDANDALSPHT